MRCKVIINESKTFEAFGYFSTDLQQGSHKKVIVECTECKRLVRREFRNASRQHQCPVIEGNKKRCYRCSQWKDLSLFNASSRCGTKAKLCRECYNSHPSVKKSEADRRRRISKSLDNDLPLFIKTRTCKLKNNSKQKNIPFDLDSDYLMQMWQNQDGKCYYSNLPMSSSMTTEGFQPWDSPSIDRKIPEAGYVKGNVVWTIFSVNSFKLSLTESQFREILAKIKWIT